LEEPQRKKYVGIVRKYPSLPACGNISLEGIRPGIYLVEIQNLGVRRLVKY
jgi:hypothetical protein